VKQVFRRVLDSKGNVKVLDVPAPRCGANRVLVATHYSAISAGTEGATLKKTFPELIKQSLKDPWTRNAVKGLIVGAPPKKIGDIVWDEITLMRPIGYSGAGMVLEVGEAVRRLKPGDRVAFAAEGHAEVVAPSQNLTVRVPEGVALRDAAFVTVGGIAMQAVRRAEVQLGERVAVIGLGLVGLIVAQLVHSSGGHVIGVDVNGRRLEDLAELVPESFAINGAELDSVQGVIEASGGFGADTVIICASSNDPVVANQAMKMCRKQGKVVFVGIVKMDLERMPFFRNELDLRFSRAYGPGSYDRAYETGRIDYPQHYVRWTEERNLEEFLQLMSEGRVQVDLFSRDNFAVEKAQEAYDAIARGSVAVVLEYPGARDQSDRGGMHRRQPRRRAITGRIRVGVIGCGNFARTIHLPNLRSNKAFEISALASATGANAASVAERFDVRYSTTNYRDIIEDPDIDAVLVATRHDLHAEISCTALAAGKHVFCEKPAAMDHAQYDALHAAVESAEGVFMLGYNRRYAPLARILKEQLSPTSPMLLRYQVSIPPIPSDHWTLDPQEGGGRLIGEAEHFFDMINFLVGNAPQSVSAACISQRCQSVAEQYNFQVDLDYTDRALASVTYSSFGSPRLPRETIEVHQNGQSFTLADYKSLRRSGSKTRTWRRAFADLGHAAELTVFSELIRSPGERTTDDILAASRISLEAMATLAG